MPSGRFQKKKQRVDEGHETFTLVKFPINAFGVYEICFSRISTPEVTTTMADIRAMLTASEPKDPLLILSFSLVVDVTILEVTGSELKVFWLGPVSHLLHLLAWILRVT